MSNFPNGGLQGAPEVRFNAGAPVNGTDAVHTLTLTGTPTGGTFRVSLNGLVSPAINYNDNAAAIQTKLRTVPPLANVVIGGSLSAGLTVTYGTDQAKKKVSLLVLSDNSLTGGTNPSVSIAESTPGVDATHRGAPKGTLLLDMSTPGLYQNTGTDTIPVWTGGPHIAQQAAITALTDNSTGTASNTVAAITDVPTKNAVASIVAKQNAIIAALHNAGLTL